MTLTKEQISELKKQLHEQIKNLPAEQKKEAENQINLLSDEAIEEMLHNQKESQIKVFREIVSGKIPSKKLSENEYAIAVLEIKPVSKGHVLVIPKERVNEKEKMPEGVIKFVEKMGKEISIKLKPKSVKIIPEEKFGEWVINLIPVYDKDLSIENDRLNTTEEELEKILIELKKEEPKKEEKEEKKKLEKLPRRIP